jgi:hypothetical protein
MSRVFSSKAAQLWAERIAQCERSNLSAPKFCQSIGCWLTSYAPPGTAHFRGGVACYRYPGPMGHKPSKRISAVTSAVKTRMTEFQ